MNKLDNVWVFAEDLALIKELCTGAASLGEHVSAIATGDKAEAQVISSLGVEAVYYAGDFSAGKILESYFDSIIALAKEKKPNLILIGASKKGRLLAGTLAAALETNVMTDVSEVNVADGGVQTKRMVYGGAAFRTDKSCCVTNIVCVGTGMFEPVAEGNAAASIIEIPYVIPAHDIRMLEKKDKAMQTINLKAAKRVIGVGRGFSAEADLQLAYDFAAAIDAEIGCTRPISEEEKWMDKSRYIGISGIMLKPDIYFGLGVSGQIQHMVGVNTARVIVAVNNDKRAPIFQQSDYGIVGDVKTVLPILTEKFKG